MGGGNLIMHGAGWLEGGLVASFESSFWMLTSSRWSWSSCSLCGRMRIRLASIAIREVGREDISSVLPYAGTLFRRPSMRRSFQTGETISMGRGREARGHAARQHGVEAALAEYQQPYIDPAVETN